MAPRPPRPRPQKRQNFQNSQRYNKAPPRWLQQAIQMPSPTPWNSQPNNPLNDMEMELEIMRRQRQMLQEKRQLLEEQAELERIQNKQQGGYSNMNPWSETLPYKPGPTSEYQGNRGQKRAGPAQNFGQAKRSGAYGSEKPPSQSMEYQAAKDVGPAQLPNQTFLGADTASRSVLGKLELCLGHVLKEMREQILEPKNISVGPSQLKILKQRIRERIHKMMMNKEIPDTPQIHNMYRSLHTAKGDERLIAAVIEGRGPVTPAKTAAPVKAEALAPDAPKQSPRAQGNKGKHRNQPNTQENKERQEKVRLIKLKLRVLLEDKMDGIFENLVKLASDGVEGEGAKQSNDVTMKPEPAGASIAPADGEAAPADKAVATADEVVTTADEVVTPADKAAAPPDEAVASADEAAAPANAPIAQSAEESKETPDVMIIDPIEEEKKFIEEEVFKAMKRSLPMMLARYKHIMVAILANEPAFIDLGLKAPEKLPELKKMKIYEKLYHVKVMSRPSLPERAVMKQFLDQFNTVSIKKHKAIYNLLFVGVPSLEDQQRLLDHNGAVIGGKTLDIRVSEKEKDKYTPPGPAAVTKVEDGQGESQPDSKTQDQTKDGQDVKLENAMTALDSEINDFFQCLSDNPVPQEEGASQNPEETIEIPDDDGLDAENGEVAEDAMKDGAETQNEENKNVEAEANGVVEIADDDSQEDTGVDEQKGEADVEAVENQSDGTEEKNQEMATGIRTRRSSRIPQK